MERVEQAEEEDEGWEQEPFPSSLHPERRHHRDERRAALFLLGEQRTDHPRPERDIGIEQQSERRLDPPPTLLKSPQLAGPSIRKRSAAADFENQRGRCSLLRDLSRVVAGAVVDQDNPQAPPLMSKRRDRVANDCRLVTGRNEDRHVFEADLRCTSFAISGSSRSRTRQGCHGSTRMQSQMAAPAAARPLQSIAMPSIGEDRAPSLSAGSTGWRRHGSRRDQRGSGSGTPARHGFRRLIRVTLFLPFSRRYWDSSISFCTR